MFPQQSGISTRLMPYKLEWYFRTFYYGKHIIIEYRADEFIIYSTTRLKMTSNLGYYNNQFSFTLICIIIV